MKKPRIYISGPISGTDIEKTRKKFKLIQLKLEEQGYEAFNPMENGLPAESSTNEHSTATWQSLPRKAAAGTTPSI